MSKIMTVDFSGRLCAVAFAMIAAICSFAGYAEADVCSDNSSKPFSFIVFGDSRGSDSGISPVLEKLANTMAAHVDSDKPAPSFAVFLGDAASTGGLDNLNLWDNAISALQTKIPVLFVKGNHDIYNDKKAFTRDSDFQDFQRKRLESRASINSGCVERPIGSPNYSAFSFMWDGSLFVILDTYDVPQPDGQYNGWISSRQMGLLKKALDSSNARHKFVFAHTPAFDNGVHGNAAKPQYLGSWSSDFMEMWKIIDRNKVDTVFNGHDHFYARKKIDNRLSSEWNNGVLEVISGGAGAPFNDPESCVGAATTCLKYDNPANTIKTNHFIIVTVDAAAVSYTVYDVNDKQIDQYVVSTN
ncbi:MAG: metallophosphoesterase [Candidatus Magnetominusculus sp. LBB02]|nr:metallophosphoesterase [Candidatus Magnetominusculus sp. LBB02]